MVAALRELVEVGSHASDPAGVATVGRLVGARLTESGLVPEFVTPPPLAEEKRWLAPIIFPEAGYDRVADIVVARLSAGQGAPRVLLLGDLDTSYPPGAGEALGGFRFQVAGERALGPGVADMKGGLVTLVGALRALHATGLAAPALTVVLSPDEQAGSLRSRPVIERLARDCDVCLCLECARDGGHLMRTRAAVGVGLLEAFGVEAHAGSAHGAGRSAVRLLAEIIPAIEGLTSPPDGDFVTVGIVRGGRRRSVVPGYAECVVDVRAATTDGWRRLDERISETVRRIAGPDRARWRGANHRPAVTHTDGARALLAVIERAGGALGIPIRTAESAAAGSSSFAADMGLPTIDGMGPSGGALMTDHEYIEWPSLVERAGLLALTLHLLAVDGWAA
jgi:glutamate carboxypeptidase